MNNGQRVDQYRRREMGRRVRTIGKGAIRTRRASWTVVDQGISSVSNLVFVASVARSSDLKTFGAFSLAYILYGLVLGAGRAVGGDVLLLRSEEDPTNVKCNCRRLLGLAVLLGLVTGALVVLVSLAASGAFARSLFAMAVVLPILLTQDALRYCFFAMGSPARAASNDLIWLVVQLLAFSGLFLWHSDVGPDAIIAAWALGAAVALAVGCLRAGLAPMLRQASRWLTQDRSRVLSFLADFLMVSGSSYGSLYFVAVIGSVSAVGSLRGGVLLFAPLDALVAGVRIFTLPALARSRSRGAAAMCARAGLISTGMGAIVAVWTTAVLIMPHSWGLAILGRTWDLARPLIPAISLGVAARLVSLAAVDGLRALGGGRALVRLRTLATALAFSAVILGTALDGAQGAANGFAGASFTAAGLWWRGFFRTSRMKARRGGKAGSLASA